MVTVQVFLGLCLFTSLIVAFPQKSSGGGATTATNYASYHGGAPSFAAAPYSAAQDAYSDTAAPVVVQAVQAAPVIDSGSSVLVQDAAGVPQVVQTAPAQGVLSSGLSMAGYAAPSLLAPVQVSDADAAQAEQGTQWAINPTVFDAGSADTPAIDDVLSPPALPPLGPTLTSGELSRVEKEAELGNYQQQTEDFGYPAVAGSGQEFGQGLTVLMPGVGLGGAGMGGVGAGGFRPVSPGNYNWLFLYGLHPPGLYSTFSQHHEAGKDYSKAIHYLKEHVTDDDSGQQKKFF